MEGVEGGARYKGRLVGDPDMLYALEGVCKHYPLRRCVLADSLQTVSKACSTNPVAQSHLKDGPEFCDPCSCPLCVFIAKLQ